MKPESRDKAHLWDMLQAADEARELCRGLSFETLALDRRTLLALERLTSDLTDWFGIPGI